MCAQSPLSMTTKEKTLRLSKRLGAAAAATAAVFAMMPSASAAAHADTMSAPRLPQP